MIYSKINVGISHHATKRPRLHQTFLFFFLFDCVGWFTDSTSSWMASIKEVFRKGTLRHRVLFILAELCKSVSSWYHLFLLLPRPEAPACSEKSSRTTGRALSDLEGPTRQIAQKAESSENWSASWSTVEASVTSQVVLMSERAKNKEHRTLATPCCVESAYNGRDEFWIVVWSFPYSSLRFLFICGDDFFPFL